MKDFPSTFYDIQSGMHYPFNKASVLHTDFILDISLHNTAITYLETVVVQSSKVVLNFSNSLSCTVNFSSGDYPIYKEEKIVGYVYIGQGVLKYKNQLQTITLTDLEVLSECVNYAPILESFSGQTGDIVLEEGFNIDISTEDNKISIVPSLGEGKGQYCGEPLFEDGVYVINSITPNDDGSIRWNNSNQFLIETGDSIINFNLTIPEERLTCERTGFKGPKGFTGPKGQRGTPGQNATPIIFGFDNDTTEIL